MTGADFFVVDDHGWLARDSASRFKDPLCTDE
jgi:hypothetical protein